MLIKQMVVGKYHKKVDAIKIRSQGNKNKTSDNGRVKKAKPE